MSAMANRQYAQRGASRSPPPPQTMSPLSKFADKIKMGRSIVADNTQRKYQPATSQGERLYTPNSQADTRYAHETTNSKSNGQQQFETHLNGTPYAYTDKKPIDPTRFRIDTLLEQNRHLLAENNELASHLNSKCQLVTTLEQKLQHQIHQEIKTLEQIEFEKNKFVDQFHHKCNDYERTIGAMGREISAIREEKINFELLAQDDMAHLREAMSREAKCQIDTMMANHSKTVEIFEIEAQKLKSIIHEKVQIIEELDYQLKTTSEKNRNTLQGLNSQINHLNHMHKMEMSELRIEMENQLSVKDREHAKEIDMLKHNCEMELKRLRNEIVVGEGSKDKLAAALNSAKLEISIKEQEVLEKKSSLEQEIIEASHQHKQVLFVETQRIKQLSEAELQQFQKYHECEMATLKAELNRMRDLNLLKTEQIVRLHQQIDQLRSQLSSEAQTSQTGAEELKNKLYIIENLRAAEDEIMKTKFAHLHSSDLQSLRKCYQDAVEGLTGEIAEQEGIIKSTRERLHQEIRDRNNSRKQHELEVEKLKTRIAELELKLAAAITDRSQQINNFGSQMELTSMNLIREAKEKQRLNSFSEEEKKKLQQLIDSKNKEIEELNKLIVLMRQAQNVDSKAHAHSIEALNLSIEDLRAQLKKQRAFYDTDLSKRQSQLKALRESHEQEVKALKAQKAQKYDQAVTEHASARVRLEVELAKVRASETQLREELAIALGNLQQEALDKDAALGTEKSKFHGERAKLQINLKTHYESIVKQLRDEIASLRQQLSEKQFDIREQNKKIGKLERKLTSIVESHEKLREVENCVVALGQENSLVKNLTEMLTKRR